MDPLSITASVITLLTTIKTAKECLEKIRRSLGAETLVLELLNEATDFNVLLANVEAFNDTGALSAKSQVTINHSLLRAKDTFDTFLEFVLHKLFSKNESPTEGEQLKNQVFPTVSRRAWYFYEKQAAKHKDCLRQARESLHFALTVANTGIHLDLREIIWSSQSSVQTELAAHSKIVDELRVMMQQMSDQHSERSRSSSISSERTLVPAAGDDVLIERSSNQPPAKEALDQEAVCFRTTVLTSNCTKSCSCTCHSKALIKSPAWLGNLTGLLFMRYSGTPVLNPMTCSKRRCRERHQSKLDASYYFPRWMLHRMIEVTARWDVHGAPKMSLRVMKVIPDTSPVFGYAMEGNLTGIQELFANHLASPVDIRDSDGRSALHVAIYYGQISTAKFLLDQDADREYKDKYFQSAIGACWEISLQKLPMPTIDPSVIGGPTEFSDYLEERKLSPVHKIVLGISSASLDDYLSLTAAEIDKQDVMGKAPLHFAAARGDFAAVSTLLRHGADPHITSDALWTPLHEAAMSSNHYSLRLLLEAGAHVDALNNRGQNALILAAYVRDDPRYFDSLLDYHTDIYLADNTGVTALHRACFRDRIETARTLISLKADVDARDNQGLSPLHLCVLNNSHNVLKLLLGLDARVDLPAINGRTVLHDAAAVGDLGTIMILAGALHRFDELDPNAHDQDGCTMEEILYVGRASCVAENDKDREKIVHAFLDLLERLRERRRIYSLVGILEEKLEIQSTASDDSFFEAMELMESSVESLALIGGLNELVLS